MIYFFEPKKSFRYMYSRLLDFLLNLLLGKWFWFLSLFLTCSKAFLSSTSKACFYSKLKCTFCVSTWYLWTSTILKAVLCFQKYIQSCLFYAVTAVVHLWVFFFFCCARFCSWNSDLEKKFNRGPKRSSAGDFIQLHFEEDQPVGCHCWRK